MASVLIVGAAVIGFNAWQSSPDYELEPGYLTLEKAYHEQRSDFMTEVGGEAVRLLAGDGASLQKFVISLTNGQDVMVVHDIQAANPVPLSLGDQVTVRGYYSWTETGGTISRTHRDRSLQRRHGWINHQGTHYD